MEHLQISFFYKINKYSFHFQQLRQNLKGKYVAKYYNPNTDLIFNPFDQRSVNWDIWSDFLTESHYNSFAASIIPDKKINMMMFGIRVAGSCW